MFIRRQLIQPGGVPAVVFSHASRALERKLSPLLNTLDASQQPRKLFSLTGSQVGSIGKSHIGYNVWPSVMGRFGGNSTSLKEKESTFIPWAVSFRNFIHSGNAKEFDAGLNSRNPNLGEAIMDRIVNNRLLASGNTGYERSILDRTGYNGMDGLSFSRRNIEQNADIVHIKILRNNTFVTVTDSKGNKKFGVSAGKLTDKGGKVSRYAAEATAEQIGRDARGRGIRSLVVKVNGFTYFKKKKQAILSLKEGYSHSRADKNPIVYIEDTTRRPHNGCRLRKKRRV